MQPPPNATVFIVDDDASVREALAWLLRSRNLLGQGWLEFSVADVGPGIPEEVAQQLFTPFFTTKSEGMGLGLSLCRTVIEQHGGALDYDTGPAGTAFRFTLRAAP